MAHTTKDMNSTIRDLIKNLEMELLQPDVRTSRHRLSELIADNFIEIGASGKYYRKNDIIENLPMQERAIYLVSGFSVIEISSDSALAVYTIEKTIADTGQKTSSLRSSLWKKIDKRWQLLFHQGTFCNNTRS